MAKKLFTVRISADTPDATEQNVLDILKAALSFNHPWLHIDYVTEGDGKQR